MDPTLYGPVCAGNAGVGLMRLNHAIPAAVWSLALPVARRDGTALAREGNVRGKDSVAAMLKNPN